MRVVPNWIANPKSRSHWRGVVAGLVSHYLTVAVLIALLFALRPFVWAALYGVPYSPTAGPVDPTSNEGTLLQVIGMLSWVPAGAAALHWSANGSLKPVLSLLVYMGALLAIGFLWGDVPPMPLSRAIWYSLSGPLGLAMGVHLYQRRIGALHGIQHLSRAPGEQ